MVRQGEAPVTALGDIPTDIGRLGAFSDGVFAIAATLLALDSSS